jgi:DedD protein
MTSQDTEITLGSGKILALFFGLVIFSAVIFGLGYTLGKSSSRPALAAESTTTNSVGTRTSGTRSGAMEASGKSGDQMGFYKNVGQKDTSVTAPSAPKENAAAEEPAGNKEPQAPDPATVSGTSAYFVQVAAVTKHEDAEALVEALKKKQYPALISNASASDKLFRVQVGPYSDIKDAEVMRTKLVGDGYNPILKK